MINSFSTFSSASQFNPSSFESVFREKSLEDALRVLTANSSLEFKEELTGVEESVKSVLSSGTSLNGVLVDWLSYALVFWFKPITYYYEFEGLPLSVSELKETENQLVREELFTTLRERSLTDSKYDMIFMALVVFLSTENHEILRELTNKAFSALFCLVNKKQTFETDICFS